jgi:hypothetical protein
MFKLNSAEPLSSAKLISLRKSIFDCCRIVAAHEAILAAMLATMLAKRTMLELAAIPIRA